MMKYTPYILFGCAVVVAFLSLFGDDSFSALSKLKENLERQRKYNAAEQERVFELKKRVLSLQKDDRALEKAARNELGLAREDELVFIFADESGEAK